MKANRFGYRVEFDRIDGAHYVEDAHGGVIAGPFATDDAGWAWIADWVDRMDQLRDLVREREERRREQLNALMRTLFARDRTVEVPQEWEQRCVG